jgi:undecaprenyl pyrophosphate synthase
LRPHVSITGRKSIIVTLTGEHTRQQLVTLTREDIYREIISGNLKPEKITEELITERIQIKGMPDPEDTRGHKISF